MNIVLDFRVWDDFHPQTTSRFWFSEKIGLQEFFQWVGQHPNAIHNVNQFIGKIDSADKKVYVGDIVTFRPKSNKGPLYKVVYDMDSCGYVFQDKKGNILKYEDGDMYGPVHFNENDVRIMGNIYENPELMA